jgi:IMP cyclohydrolase
MTESGVLSYLAANKYAGRGILIGLSEDASQAIIGYFLMGRSSNSRNRVICEQGNGLLTRAWDEKLVQDPSLIIYTPLRVEGRHTIVSNGDQTDTIVEYLKQGSSFEAALRTRVYEPDAPHFTPRISGIASVHQGNFSYKLSIIKRTSPGEPACLRQFFEYEPTPGLGHLIHTYMGDGELLPSFTGEPVAIPLAGAGDIGSLTGGLWQALDADNRVSLAVRYINLADMNQVTMIVNRHGQGE